MVFQPLLGAGAAGGALVAARVAIGRGGAVFAVLVFYASRAPLALLLSAGLGHALPKFPLYLGEALAVEVAYVVARRLPGAAVAVVAGLLVGTAGLATEWGWVHLWYQYPWQTGLLPYMWIAVVAAVAGAVIGHAMGSVLAGQRPQPRARSVVAAMIALGVVLAVHLPTRSVDGASAPIATTPAATTPVVDAQGLVEQHVTVRAAVQPPDAAHGADRFDVVAWQGHAPLQHIELQETAPGHYAGTGNVPVGGSWKSVLILGHGDVIEAAPIALPADPASGLKAVAPPRSRTAPFVPAVQLLMREVHSAAEWPFVVILTLFALATIAWAVALAVCFALVARENRATREQPLLGRRVSPPRTRRAVPTRR